MRINWKIALSFGIILIGLQGIAQTNSTLTGKITDQDRNPLGLVNISIPGTKIGTSSNQEGFYTLVLPPNERLTIILSMLGYESREIVVNLNPGEERVLDITLTASVEELREVQVTGARERTDNFIQLDLKDFKQLPSITGEVEAALKTLPGVSSNTELSSQYSVRGGNYDENLVYVNDIEIYRPFLIRSGQQEGLSFVNSDMVASLQFSAGGFDATYGDKMSSVLDITYRQPQSFSGSASASLLGGSLHLEGISKNSRFTHATGIRYKSTRYLLNSFDTQGDYNPVFTDIQTFLTYDLSKKWELSFLGNYANNKYQFIPQDRRTSFGTITDAVQLFVLYDGQEVDKFTTWQGAISADFRPSGKILLKFIASAFHTSEEETLDIQGRYSLNALDKELGSENLGDSIMNIGIGRFIDHARNFLDAEVISGMHKGSYQGNNHHVKWGASFRHEMIDDYLNEWKFVDSAGFSIPYSDTEVILADSRWSSNKVQSNRITAYLQDKYELPFDSNHMNVNGGIRINYWDFNKQFIISPRITINYWPEWNRDFRIHFSAGYYYQPPFYKEIRNPEGEINPDIKAQKSIHLLLGGELNFTAWERPFKFTTDIYYKRLTEIIPYKVDNVRIDYSGTNMAEGYATGIDMKINGEFVPGVESWASLSFMQTRENITSDFYLNEEGERIEPGYYPRPTDQLVNFGLFFQDYFPNNPTYKVHLNLLFGTGLPASSPYSNRYDQTFRMPSYRRVDLGFSKIISNTGYTGSSRNFLKTYKSIWIGLEVFNLFDVNNTISYLWITTVNNLSHVSHQYAVPNYLTSRRINVKANINF
jgi:hypothetical protein